MNKSPLRLMLTLLGGCAIVLGLLMPLVFSIGPSDPLGSYRDPARAARTRATVAEIGRIELATAPPVVTSIKVRHPGQPAGAPPAFLSDYGLGAPRWQNAFKEGDTVEVAYLKDQPTLAHVPVALLDEVPAPPAPGLFAPLAVFLAYAGGGVALLALARRTPEATMQSWMPAPLPKGSPKPPPNPRVRAVGYKVAAGVFVALLLPVLLLALPNYVRNTRDAFASQSWPQAPGTIIEARVGEHTSSGRRGAQSVSYRPRVTARFDVDGRTWRTQTIRFNYLEGGSKDEAAAVAGRYKVGATVPVRYEPGNPGHAVLEPGPVMPDAALYGALAAAGVFLCLGGLWLLLRPLPAAAGPAPRQGGMAAAA